MINEGREDREEEGWKERAQVGADLPVLTPIEAHDGLALKQGVHLGSYLLLRILQELCLVAHVEGLRSLHTRGIGMLLLDFGEVFKQMSFVLAKPEHPDDLCRVVPLSVKVLIFACNHE